MLMTADRAPAPLPGPAIPLPDPDVIRDRIEALDAEARLCRRLLRLVNRFTPARPPGKPATAPIHA